MAEYERKMNESIANGEGLGDTLIGLFEAPSDSEDTRITIRLASQGTDDYKREFCIYEKIDCFSQSDTEDTSNKEVDLLKCPDTSKNKQCGTFKWDGYGFTKDQLDKKYCIAMSTVSPDSGKTLDTTLHDRNSCGDYGAKRLWFRSYDGNEMFEALMSHLSHCKDNLKQ